MRVCSGIPVVTRALGRRLRQAALTAASGFAILGPRFAYRRQELTVIALLSASLLGGLVVDRWRTRSPATLQRLEAEPPRLAAAARSAAAAAHRLRDRHGTRVERVAGRAPPDRPRAAPAPDAPLDLNAATATDLTRLPGIGPRLAERIVGRRQALGGRFGSIADLATVPGLGRRRAARISTLVTADGSAAGSAAAEEPASGGSGRPPEEPP